METGEAPVAGSFSFEKLTGVEPQGHISVRETLGVRPARRFWRGRTKQERVVYSGGMGRRGGAIQKGFRRGLSGALSLSAWVLILVNLLPMAGVLFLGWDAGIIVLLYWMENLVVGLFSILRIAFARSEPSVAHLGKLFIIPFFCIHFGGFCAVHGLFLSMFFKLGASTASVFPETTWAGPLVFLQLLGSVVVNLWRGLPQGMGWAVLALVASHGLSFVRNYLLGGEYEDATVGQQMMRPYKRIAILHVTILAGGVPVVLLGSPVPLVLLLILIKAGIDVVLHVREHGNRVD